MLKGPSIARWLYDDGTVRPYEDVDLLVAPDQVDAAGAVLAERGYAPICLNSAEGELGGHALEWVQRGWPTIDLHWTVHGVQASRERCWLELSVRTEQLMVGGTAIEVLSPAALAFNVVLHAVTSGTAHPKALEDLARALRRADLAAWHAALDLATRLDALAPFGVGLRLVPEGQKLADALGIPRSGSVELVLRASSTWHTALPFERVARARGLGAKAAIVAREVFPTPAFIAMWFPQVSSRRGGVLIAYPYRLYWVVRNAPRGLAAWRRARRTVAASSRMPADPF